MAPLSVLLIIGSAVVGPIEAQDVACPPAAVIAPDAKCCLASRRGLDGRWVCDKESLPQLCERAMREVGAANGYVGRREDVISGPTRQSNGHVTSFSQVTNPGVEVRCISTPAGYRK